MPIPALIGAAGALLASGANALFNKSNNAANVANQWALFNAQNRRQDYLNANADLIKRNSLLKAGLNVNSDFGANPNLVGTSVTPANQQAFQIDPSLLVQLPQMKLAEEQAEAQHILNQREKNKDVAANKYLMDDESFDSSLSEDLKSIGVDPSLVGLNADNVLPEVSVGSKKKSDYNLGDFEFRKMSKSFEHDLKSYDADDARWSLEVLVHRAQAADKNIIDFLTKLPKAEFDRLAALTKEAIASANLHDAQTATEGSRKKLFDAQEAYTRLQEKIANDSNLSQLFDKMVNDGFSFENVGKLLIAAFVQWLKPR